MVGGGVDGRTYPLILDQSVYYFANSTYGSIDVYFQKSAMSEWFVRYVNVLFLTGQLGELCLWWNWYPRWEKTFEWKRWVCAKYRVS